jgi:hypothetical protein
MMDFILWPVCAGNAEGIEWPQEVRPVTTAGRHVTQDLLR